MMDTYALLVGPVYSILWFTKCMSLIIVHLSSGGVHRRPAGLTGNNFSCFWFRGREKKIHIDLITDVRFN